MYSDFADFARQLQELATLAKEFSTEMATMAAQPLTDTEVISLLVTSYNCPRIVADQHIAFARRYGTNVLEYGVLTFYEGPTKHIDNPNGFFKFVPFNLGD